MTIEEMQRRYLAGAAIKDIAIAAGSNYSRTRKLLIAHGTPIRERAETCALGGKNRTHGLTVGGRGRNLSPEYMIWCGMRQRCQAPASTYYHRYGGRGIKVCSRWDDFAAFMADMGPRPSARHSIDRVDNDGNYEPGNCRWATKREQGRNRQGVHMVQYGDFLRPARDVAERNCVSIATFKGRLEAGWTALDAATRAPKFNSRWHEA